MKNFLLVTDFKWQANLMRFYTEQRKTSYEQRDLYELSNSTGRNLESGLHTANRSLNSFQCCLIIHTGHVGSITSRCSESERTL